MSDEQPPEDPSTPDNVIPMRRPVSVGQRRIERTYGKRGFCHHKYVDIDAHGRIVECRSCKATLDPIDVLNGIASDEDWQHMLASDLERLRSEVERLGEERKKLSTAVGALRRRARNDDPTMRHDYMAKALEIFASQMSREPSVATFAKHFLDHVLKGHSLDLAWQSAGNAQHIANQHAKRERKVSRPR